ncbi:MAG: hypothetical protein QOI94_3529, partial [Acidobacteriaceae bacterium]|nr:hypothetical protein [Acidobacteriaceae bacterium]
PDAIYNHISQNQEQQARAERN